jgi:hypothetical protein
MLAGREYQKDDGHVQKFIENFKVGPYCADNFHTFMLPVTKILCM